MRHQPIDDTHSLVFVFFFRDNGFLIVWVGEAPTSRRIFLKPTGQKQQPLVFARAIANGGTTAAKNYMFFRSLNIQINYLNISLLCFLT